jgi:glutamine amidotransferase
VRSAPPLSVAIVPTGTANTASVRAAFTRLGVEARVVSDPSALGRAERVVLPGVGALEPAMDALRGKGIASLLTDRIEAGRPTLAICLGLQLLGEASDESPGVAALGCLPVRARKLPREVRVPHMGWNRVEPGTCWSRAMPISPTPMRSRKHLPAGRPRPPPTRPPS